MMISPTLNKTSKPTEAQSSKKTATANEHDTLNRPQDFNFIVEVLASGSHTEATIQRISAARNTYSKEQWEQVMNEVREIRVARVRENEQQSLKHMTTQISGFSDMTQTAQYDAMVQLMDEHSATIYANSKESIPPTVLVHNRKMIQEYLGMPSLTGLRRMDIDLLVEAAAAFTEDFNTTAGVPLEMAKQYSNGSYLTGITHTAQQSIT